MERFKDYDVRISGLKSGVNNFDFNITQSFFDLFEFEQDFKFPDLHLDLSIDNKTRFLDFSFHLTGTVEVNCDITNEPFRQKVEGNSEIIIKFGEEFDDSDDEVWIIPEGEHTVNISREVYELSLLSIPFRRIHPDVLSGKSDSEMLDLLDQYSPEQEENSDKKETDPRWEALKKLKNDN